MWWAVQLTYTTDKAQGGASCEISECRPKACSSLMVARQRIRRQRVWRVTKWPVAAGVLGQP